MASQNQYGVLKWTSDNNKLSIHHLKHILRPVKYWNEFRVGDEGVARYPGLPGEWPFEILAVSATRQSLTSILADLLEAANEADLVEVATNDNGRATIAESSTGIPGHCSKKGGHGETGKNMVAVHTQIAKRSLFDNQDTQAAAAKKAKQTVARTVEKACEITNRLMSARNAVAAQDMGVLSKPPDMPETKTPQRNTTEKPQTSGDSGVETALLLSKVSELMPVLRNLETQVRRLTTAFHGFARCRQCSKLQYKTFRDKENFTSPVPSLLSPGDELVEDSVSAMVPESPASTLTSPMAIRQPLGQLPCQVDPVKIPVKKEVGHEHVVTDTGLVFLGDARYSIRVDAERLTLCHKAGTTRDKLALNVLELLITREECQSLSIQGQCKGKTAMDPAKRRALKYIIKELIEEMKVLILLSWLCIHIFDSEDSYLEQLLADQQDDGQAKKLLLSEIQHDYEAEKAALLSQMRRQSDRASAERERQQAMVVLRRDQRRLQQEEQTDAALLVWKLGQKHQEGAEKSFTSERERQQQLAKQRLAERQASALHGKDKALVQSVDATVMNEEEQAFQQLLKSDDSSLYAALLALTENIHTEERDSLLVLIDRVKSKPLSSNNSIQEVTQFLKDVAQNYAGWMKAKHNSDIDVQLEEMTRGERDAYYKDLTRERQAIMDRLEQVITHRVQLTRIQKGVSVINDALWEELSVSLLTDLQQRQSFETNTLQTTVAQSQDDQTLTRLYQTQHRAHQQCWMVNLHTVAMAMPDVDGAAMETVAMEMKEKEGDELAKLDSDHEREKEEALEEARKAALAGEPVDVDAIMKQLEAQYQAKRQNLEDSFQEQRLQMMEKLEAKRFARAKREYEEDSALHLVLLSSKESDTMREKSANDKERQQKLMQDRLTARREEARKKSEAQAVAASEAEAEREKHLEDNDSRPSTSDSIHRDRSPLGITVTDDQKHEVYHRLMRQQTQLKLHITKEQSRQEEMLKRRLEQRRGQRQDQAAALLSLGERQKTTLETTQGVQRDRQLNMVRERVARVKYERTMTMRDPSMKTVTFDDDIDEEDEEDTEQKHRRMSLLGRELEKKFKEGHSDQSNVASQGATAEGVLLGEDDKMARLKERRAQRRAQRQGNKSS